MRRIMLSATPALAIALALTTQAHAQYEGGGQDDYEGGGDYGGGGDVQGGGDFAGPGAEMDIRGTGLPLSFSQRPLTLTAGTIRGDAALRIAHIEFTLPPPLVGSASETAVALLFGGAYGIMDDFEVGALVLPLLLAPDLDYGDPSLYAVFRFLRGDFEMGGQLAMSLPVQGDFVLTPSLPMLLHLGDNMRLDTGVALPIQFADPDTIVSLSIPLRFSFNATPNLFFGASTGFHLPDFDADRASLPLGFHGGYTLESGTGGPMADFMVELAFPAFLMPGSDGDVVFTNLWTLTFGANFYIDT